ncbi:MAG: ribosome small subunit-dependent GTPase A [Lactiplantibacillus argentoratensis]
MTINLTKYGLTTAVQVDLTKENGQILGRIIGQHRDWYQVITTAGERSAQVTGKLAYEAASPAAFPAVGDWVYLASSADNQAQIEAIEPRQSVLARGAVNHQDGQIIATNINTIFICMSLNADFNVRRLERYLTIAWDSGALPVIVLTKADVCTDLATKLRAVADVSVGVPTITCSAETGQGLDELQPYLTTGQTVAFVGSSGVGKSTLINRLLGQDILATKSIRTDDDKGRHTTTSRQLIPLPTGACVIDTPGMRELQIFMGDLNQTFAEIAALATQCKFNDCTHTSEPGCAVRAAVEAGTVTAERLQSYQKLQREMSYQGLNSRQLEQAKIQRMFGGKQAMKRVKQRYHRD